MRVVDYRTYTEEKKNFMEAHNYNYHIETSPMDEYGRYYKNYLFEDGAIWYETMKPVWEKVSTSVEVKKLNSTVEVDVEVKLFETEYYTTDNSKSSYYYERF